MTHRANALTVLQMLPGLDGGGVEQGTLEMGAWLVAQGHRALVVSQGGRMVADLENAGVKHFRQTYIGEKSPRALLHFAALRRLLRVYRVDVLHLRSRLPAWVGYWVWQSLPPSQRPALVTTFHGFYSINPYSAIMTRGQRVIAVSRTIARHVQMVYGISPRRIRIIYRGFDHQRFDPDQAWGDRLAQARRMWRLPDPCPPLILMPGRLTRLKGHLFLLESLARLPDQPWLLVCTGHIDERSTYTRTVRQTIQKLNLPARVRLTGHWADMPAAMQLADVVVCPSLQPESFGRVAVEAQAMGKPVIATAHGGSLETILNGRTGCLVMPGQVDRLRDALHAALQDAAWRRRCGHAGRWWVRRRFATETMCRQTLGVYRELLRDDPLR